MVGLFCFDGPLYKDCNGVYCNVTLTNEMFARYFSVIDELYIVVRTFSENKTYNEMNMKPLILNKMKVIEIPNFNTIHGFLFEKKKFKRKISKLLNKVDLIFARMPSQTSNAVLEMAYKLQKPYLVEVGGCAWDSFWNHGLLGKMIAPYMYFSARRNISNADFAIYVTKNFLQRRYPNNRITTNCSNVYLEEVEEDVLEKRLYKIDTIDFNHPILGQAVNSIDVKYKGEHLVIQAMSQLKKQGIIIEYQVVGPGNGEYLLSEAKKYGVEEQLMLIGTLQKNEMLNWYKNIDIYIQPSKQEGLPRSVIEAMSVGCPALGSQIAGIPELLDEDCLFNPNNIDDIAKIIKWILNRERMKSKATTLYQRSKEYDIEFIEEKRSKVFKQYKDLVIKKKELE